MTAVGTGTHILIWWHALMLVDMRDAKTGADISVNFAGTVAALQWYNYDSCNQLNVASL